MKKYLLIGLLLSGCLYANGQIIFDMPLSDRVTGYDINARLFPDEHIVRAEMTAWWVNPSDKPVPEVMMHMYLNAFSSNKTTFNSKRGWSPSGNDGWGWIRINDIKDEKGNDLASSMQYVSPDDGNEYDRSVLKIDLPYGVMPDDTLKLTITFEAKLPSPIVRTGYNEDFYFVAQWFPKFGVYETTGMRQREKAGWNCHQFHASSEFYANHSVYNVSVILPDEYISGSGGMLIEEIDNGDGTKKVVWRAEDIVDFAWTAWPGYKVVKDKWRGVDITLLTSEDALKNSGAQMQALKNALEYLDANVGVYPWPHVTFVDPPATGSGAGGMEYTTLFTSVNSASVPHFFKVPEMVTIHEFGHSYFMGILASNEFEEPWLDEGVNSYWELRIVDDSYGDGYGLMNLPFIKMADEDYGRISYVLSPSKSVATNDLYSWQYPHGTYSMMSYNKTSVWLRTLEGIIGTETMNNIFREYYRRWAFHHPSGRDFIGVVNDVVKKEHGDRFGNDMNWYFDQVLYGNEVCDYKVQGISVKKITGYAGVVEGDTVTYVKNDRKADTIYRSTVRLERVGGMMLPVDVLAGFDDGEGILKHWDGKERYMDFEFTGTHKVEWVKIDPENKIELDINRINNSYTLGKQKGDAVSGRMSVKFISLLQFLISVFAI